MIQWASTPNRCPCQWGNLDTHTREEFHVKIGVILPQANKRPEEARGDFSTNLSLAPPEEHAGCYHLVLEL